MHRGADICLIAEGGYPYALGGVGSWLDALVRTSPDLTFHVIAISVASQPRERKYEIADNIVGLTDILLDVCPAGRIPKVKARALIGRGVGLLKTMFSGE